MFASTDIYSVLTGANRNDHFYTVPEMWQSDVHSKHRRQKHDFVHQRKLQMEIDITGAKKTKIGGVVSKLWRRFEGNRMGHNP
jgi:hypothetical protein